MPAVLFGKAAHRAVAALVCAADERTVQGSEDQMMMAAGFIDAASPVSKIEILKQDIALVGSFGANKNFIDLCWPFIKGYAKSATSSLQLYFLAFFTQ
ncbi:MAG TPA: hypothetical protein DCZ95_06090 [Verrucomicrobia bacterium]|nr:MAG: hypothetical protein A2X46_03890 [Lentisphaerae bacterium GWF2_57_35]HBA83648.1 hypothetical protein [Verrucomicrobiota bacterium]